ncbi:D-lactate dehydrogenase [Ewingella americana]|nr:D-lactate dehydrogenase [Ewingella americana]
MNAPLINQLKDVVGHSHVLTKANDKVPYTKGFRVGKGEALAVALPSSLMEMWQLLKVCVAHDVIILMQASNTGVTGGSTPDGNDYDREIVIISTRKINGLHLLDDANQVLAFPGTTLTELEDALKPFHREPHSVIGSSCIGASVIGGICNNSGGSLIRRGPAFTEKSLYAAIDEQGQLQLINHLGIELGETPEEILGNLVSKHYTTGDAADWQGRIWADDYEKKLRDVDSDQPTRYNGNPEYLHESAGSSGKLAVFSVRLPTFESSRGTTTFYIGANDETELVELRRFLLKNLQASPLQAEYIHRQAFDLTIRYAKHVYKAISKQGAAKIPEMFAQKNQIDKIVRAIPILPNHAFDSLIQIYNRFTPDGVEPRIMDFHHQFEHHLMLKTEQKDAPELKTLLQNFFASRQGKFFECSSAEEKNAFLIRFGVGGCTVYYCEGKGLDINQRLVAFDVALRSNDPEWRLKLPAHLQQQVLLESCCGHFFCFVNHQDYILKPGYDPTAFKHGVLEYIETRGAKYPAEHNVGHQYHASPDYEQHMHRLDPTNSFNAGVGKTSKNKFWRV